MRVQVVKRPRIESTSTSARLEVRGGLRVTLLPALEAGQRVLLLGRARDLDERLRCSGAGRSGRAVPPSCPRSSRRARSALQGRADFRVRLGLRGAVLRVRRGAVATAARAVARPPACGSSAATGRRRALRLVPRGQLQQRLERPDRLVDAGVRRRRAAA